MTTVRRPLLSVIIALLIAAAGYSQALTSNKIPRRVYFAPAVIAKDVSDPMLEMLPDYLYTAISALQPIVRVDNADTANSIIKVSISKPGPSVVVDLVDKGAEVAKVSFTAGTFADISRFVEKAAAELAPKLPMVEPVVERTNEQGKSITANQALIQKVQLADRFARPIELSIEGPSLMRTSVGGSSNAMSLGIAPVPLIIHFDYYFSRSIGLDASLMSYYGTRIGFGRPQNTTTGPFTRVFLIMPGVGVKYRSPGTIFASFSASAYAGYGYVTNITSVPLGTNTNTSFQVFLNPGASKSIFYTLMRFASDFGYNISPRFAVHLGVALCLNPFGIGGGTSIFGYPTNDSSFFLQYLTVGLSYRP